MSAAKPNRYTNFPLAPKSRVRMEGAITRPIDGSIVQKKAKGSIPGNFSTSSTICHGGYVGVLRQTSDVVTPGYKTRSAAGEILNNPFSSILVTNAYGGRGPIVAYSGPWVAGQLRETSYDHANTEYHAEFKLPPPLDEQGNLVLPAEFTELLNSITRVQAHTSALAAVDDSTSMALASLGELKSTLKMLMNPLGQILSFLKRYKVKTYISKGKIVLRPSVSGSGPGLNQSLTGQYLSLYYGLKPLANDCHNIIAAYIEQGLNPARKTARGVAIKPATSVVSSFGLGDKGVTAASWYDCRKTVTTETACRSGILYVPTEDTYQKVLGLRWGDAIPAAYELTPWSFFVDYFSNLGKVIGALTPRSGVHYLAAWDKVVVTRTTRVESVASGTGGVYYSQPRGGNEWVEQTIRASVRSPVSPYTGVGLALKWGNFQSKTKCLAVLALINQQLTKRIPILNF